MAVEHERIGMWDYHDDELVWDEIRKERLYRERPDLEPPPSKGAQQAGLVMIVAGIFMIIMIIAVLYPKIGNALLYPGFICFTMPLIFIIVGILLLFNKKTGKLLFAVICIVVGTTFFVISILNPFGRDYDEGSAEATIVALAICLYGLFLFSRTLRKRY